MVNSVRWEQGSVFILFGLIFLAVSTILFAAVIWASGILPRWSGVPLAIGFALYIPQYVSPQEIRVTHGILILAGCILLGGTCRSTAMLDRDGHLANKSDQVPVI
ncbi:Uncharacterised protein [uncultured archaeon]|nr:Uncharacterised protein [uncultured archaeon]